MSEFLDELARTLARPMRRSQAVKVLGSALVTAAVPLLRATPAAGVDEQQPDCHNRCSGPGVWCCRKCPGQYGGVLFTCCAVGDVCNWEAPSEQYRCGRVGCKSACSKQCGSKCCREDQYCADKRRSLCCDKGEDACVVLGTPGEGPAPATQGRCCARGQKCCANDRRATCCAPKDSCCAGRCCPPDKVCTNGVCRCPRGTTRCGTRECCKSGEKCCGGHCCKKNQTCCGDHCCDAGETCCGDTCCGKGKKCCGDHCCDSSETCCGDMCCGRSETCCGGDCCFGNEVCITTRSLASRSSSSSSASIRRICCPRPRVLGQSYCCPPRTVVGRTRLTKTCCPPGNPHCCGELGCFSGEICVNGDCVKP